MKAKTKFRKMFYKLPEEARRTLIYHFAIHPMSLNVIAMEINHDTKIGKQALKDLGYKDDI